MKMCLSEGMKRIKELNERKDTLILNEQRRMRTSYKEGEQPVPVDYDYKKTREEIAKIDAEVRAIRCGISLANCTVKLDDGSCPPSPCSAARAAFCLSRYFYTVRALHSYIQTSRQRQQNFPL